MYRDSIKYCVHYASIYFLHSYGCFLFVFCCFFRRLRFWLTTVDTAEDMSNFRDSVVTGKTEL